MSHSNWLQCLPKGRKGQVQCSQRTDCTAPFYIACSALLQITYLRCKLLALMLEWLRGCCLKCTFWRPLKTDLQNLSHRVIGWQTGGMECNSSCSSRETVPQVSAFPSPNLDSFYGWAISYSHQFYLTASLVTQGLSCRFWTKEQKVLF